MKKVKIYSTQWCPYCIQVKALFESKDVPFEEIDLSDDHDALQALVEKTKWQTVPQVFIGDQFIGGFDETHKLEVDGELDVILNS